MQVRDILAEVAGTAGHRFWPDSVSLLEANQFDLTEAGPKILTDLYLLRLAAAYDGRLITFDQTIRWQWVVGCRPDDLEILTET